MKTYCKSCGVHFPEQLKDTYKRKCTFWESHGLRLLPKAHKEIIWDWLFSLPTDAIFLESNYIIRVHFDGYKSKSGTKFADIPEYRAMSEDERRRFQVIYGKAKEMGL